LVVKSEFDFKPDPGEVEGQKAPVPLSAVMMLRFFTESQNHTESQNGKAWKGPLWVI